jgi:hypothetical protein
VLIIKKIKVDQEVLQEVEDLEVHREEDQDQEVHREEDQDQEAHREEDQDQEALQEVEDQDQEEYKKVLVGEDGYVQVQNQTHFIVELTKYL